MLAFVVAFGTEVVRGPVADVLLIDEVLLYDPAVPLPPLPSMIAKRAAPAAAKTAASAAGGSSMSTG